MVNIRQFQQVSIMYVLGKNITFVYLKIINFTAVVTLHLSAPREFMIAADTE